MSGDRPVARAAVGALLALGCACPAAAQRATAYRTSTAVVPQTITVGDVFQAAVRIHLPPGTAVTFADSLALPADVETAGRRTVEVDTMDVAGPTYTAVYPLTAWRPGDIDLPPTQLVVRGPSSERQGAGGADTVEVTFPAFAIESVLPGDTTGIQPKPAKDVLGANRVWWPFLVAGAVALVLLAALYAWYRRRRPQPEASAVQAEPPRQRALAALDAAKTSGLVEQGRLKEFYTQVTDAVREYVEALDPRWGRDLTTSELAGRLLGQGIGADALSLVALLGSADLVKFARRRPAPAEAYAEWSAARRFVESFDGPPPVALPAEEAKAA